MRCEDARRQVQDAWDSREALSELARAHLATCAACRTFAAELEALGAVWAADPTEEPGPGFDTRFFARLAELKARPRRAAWHRWGWLAATLTGGAVATMLVLTLLGPSTPPIEDVELAMNLELIEELAVLSHLEEVEAFEVLAQLADDDLSTPTPEVTR